MKVHEAICDGERAGWTVFCPACGCHHLFDSRWTFNGDHEKPTFRPSMLVHGWQTTGEELPGYRIQKRCHSYVTDGQIQYLADCEHEMKGKTVDIPDLDRDCS